jgi:hypothetical protein
MGFFFSMISMTSGFIFTPKTTKINYRMDTTGEREKKGKSKKKWMEGVQAAMTTRNLEPGYSRNREE